MSSGFVDLEMCLHAETDLAIYVSDDGDNDNAVWLPRSQVEFTHDGNEFDVVVTMPVRLAIEKGLV